MSCTGDPIKRTRGDDWVASINNAITGVLSTTSGPVDLTGCTLAAQMRADSEDVSVALELTASLGDDPDLGEIVMEAVRADTADLDPCEYDVDIEVTFPGGEHLTYRPVDTDGNRIKTLVEADVTR